MTTQLVTVQNKSSLVSAGEFELIVAGFSTQIARDFNPSGHVKRGLAPYAVVQPVPAGQAPPASAWNIQILDRSDQAGALGYHDNSVGKPYGKVFAYDSRQGGVPVSSVVSHEGIEMLCDPWVDPMQPKMVRRPGTEDAYIFEACDAVQGGTYYVTLSTGEKVAVSSFCLPCWWGIGSFRPTSNTGDVTEPWQLDPRGYTSIYNLKTHQWSQKYGSEKAAPPDHDDRIQRIQRAVRERGVEAFKPQIIDPADFS